MGIGKVVSMSKSQYCIQDWASNFLQRNGRFNQSAYGAWSGDVMLFDSFDDAWEYIDVNGLDAEEVYVMEYVEGKCLDE